MAGSMATGGWSASDYCAVCVPELTDLHVRPSSTADPIAALLTERWGSTTVAVHGVVYDASVLPALVALSGETIVGLLTYYASDGGLEIVTFDALTRGVGIGTALLNAVTSVARRMQI